MSSDIVVEETKVVQTQESIPNTEAKNEPTVTTEKSRPAKSFGQRMRQFGKKDKKAKKEKPQKDADESKKDKPEKKSSMLSAFLPQKKNKNKKKKDKQQTTTTTIHTNSNLRSDQPPPPHLQTPYPLEPGVITFNNSKGWRINIHTGYSNRNSRGPMTNAVPSTYTPAMGPQLVPPVPTATTTAPFGTTTTIDQSFQQQPRNDTGTQTEEVIRIPPTTYTQVALPSPSNILSIPSDHNQYTVIQQVSTTTSSSTSPIQSTETLAGQQQPIATAMPSASSSSTIPSPTTAGVSSQMMMEELPQGQKNIVSTTTTQTQMESGTSLPADKLQTNTAPLPTAQWREA